MRLTHFTCEHAADGIRRAGKIVPMPLFGLTGSPEVVWLTDLADPTYSQLGFSPRTAVDCDRLEVRFDVVAPDAVRWIHFVKDWPQAKPFRRIIERHGAEPYHWFVTSEPVFIDPSE